MSSLQIVAAAAEPEFYQRVAFIALRVAHHIISSDHHHDDEASVAYANRIIAGAENALMLAMHVAASSERIADTLEVSGGVGVEDGKIERALESIWAVRAGATTPPQTEAVLGEMHSFTVENAPLVPRRDHDHPPPPPDMHDIVTPLESPPG